MVSLREQLEAFIADKRKVQAWLERYAKLCLNLPNHSFNVGWFVQLVKRTEG